MRFPFLALLCSIACGSDSHGPSGQPISVGDLTGSWSLELTDTAGCAGPAFANHSLTLHITWDPNGALYPSSLDLDPFTSTWSAASAGGWLSGSLSLRVPGGANLVGTVGDVGTPVPDSLRRGFEVSGRLAKNLTFSGTVTDPKFPWHPSLSTHPCVFRASAVHN